MMKYNIGFIGLGILGSPVVEDTLKKIDQLSTENQIIVLISTVLPGTIKLFTLWRF